MNNEILYSRRRFLIGGGAAVGGLLLPGCTKTPVPPTYGSILRMGDNLTYFAQRALLPDMALVREYGRRDITSFPATGAVTPHIPGKRGYSEDYERLVAAAFGTWRLAIEGSVDRPGAYSLADLKRFPSRTQITRHTCEEGWTAIGEWTGIQLSRVLLAAGMRRSASCVCFHTYDGRIESLDLIDALHPQTILAYGMNGKDLSIAHGAPVRMRVERQIGYKSVKFLRKIEVKDVFDDGGAKGDPHHGWSWYTGI